MSHKFNLGQRLFYFSCAANVCSFVVDNITISGEADNPDVYYSGYRDTQSCDHYQDDIPEEGCFSTPTEAAEVTKRLLKEEKDHLTENNIKD